MTQFNISPIEGNKTETSLELNGSTITVDGETIDLTQFNVGDTVTVEDSAITKIDVTAVGTYVIDCTYKLNKIPVGMTVEREIVDPVGVINPIVKYVPKPTEEIV